MRWMDRFTRSALSRRFWSRERRIGLDRSSGGEGTSHPFHAASIGVAGDASGANRTPRERVWRIDSSALALAHI